MTKIHIISVAKSDKTLASLVENYRKMLGWTISESEISYSKKIPPNQIKAFEANLITQKYESKAFKIALDVKGKELDSFEFAALIQQNMHSYNIFEFIIGGAFGLDSTILKQTNVNISLSKMTFPHKLVKLILYEQLYRAKTILEGHPYHK